MCIRKRDIIVLSDFFFFFSRRKCQPFYKDRERNEQRFWYHLLWIMDPILEDPFQKTLCWKLYENSEVLWILRWNRNAQLETYSFAVKESKKAFDTLNKMHEIADKFRFTQPCSTNFNDFIYINSRLQKYQ